MDVIEEDTAEELPKDIQGLYQLADRTRNAADHFDQLFKRAGNFELADLLTLFWNLKTAYTDLDEARKALYQVVDRANKKIVPEAMEKAEMDKVRVPALARSFYVQTQLSVSFTDKDKGFKWLRDNDNADIIQETVNAGTLKSLVKSMMEDEGIDPPEDIVKVSTYNQMGSSKYQPKK